MATTVAGQTVHYTVSFDNSLPNGPALADGLLSACESDFSLMESWFVGVDNVHAPDSVLLTNGPAGGTWSGSSVTLTVPTGAPVDLVRFILVAEVVEQFMDSKNNGWYGPFNEGSKGEGLSRFLAAQFEIANGLGSIPFGGFQVVPLWLNAGRPNFVDNNSDDNGQDPITGCTTCFIYYLHTQLGFSIQDIIAAGSATLAGVYQNLTGKTDGWASFSELVNNAYPILLPGGSGLATYSGLVDNIFPISQITNFFAPNQLTVGFSGSTQIVINNSLSSAVDDVYIGLMSASPTIVSVPTFVTIPPGANSAAVPIEAPASNGSFPAEVNVTASYAGQTLTMTVEVVTPNLVSIDFSANSIVAGTSPITVEATVLLNQKNFVGPLVVDLVSWLPGYASVPKTVTIPQGQISASFAVTVEAAEKAFATIQVPISASSEGLMIYGYLSVSSGLNHGVVVSMVIVPTTVVGGATSQCAVTLERAVQVDTVVGVTALTGVVQVPPGGTRPRTPRAGTQTPSGTPKPSPFAFVPSSITIPAGQTVGEFPITTNRLPAGTSPQEVVIGVGANGLTDFKQEVLTVTS